MEVNWNASQLRLSVGDTAECRGVVPPAELSELPPETMVLRAGPVQSGLLCAAGVPASASARWNVGAAYAALEAVQRLGGSFLHPLAPILPAAAAGPAVAAALELNLTESPMMAVRGFHHHTEHPLELMDVLQGADAELDAGVRVPWAEMVPEVASWFTWCVANKVNRVEWVLLQTTQWRLTGFVDSGLRASRLSQLVQLGQNFSLKVGVDVPIAEVQQNGWFMVGAGQNPEAQSKAIEKRVDWLAAVGVDFIVTESGFSEFTHPADTVMLTLMNTLADYAQVHHGIPVLIKCHCSSDQVCPDYPDPRNRSRPLNFNQLPMMATKNLGVLPHTIQAYALDDPVAGSYGNVDFGDMFDWMLWEAANDTREVVFHPETNYWVNVDIDVPLFLPLYGFRRVRDLRLIRQRMAALGIPATRFSGQIVFSSGWEFGAWLSDVITANAMWSSATLGAADDAAALRQSMAALSSAFGDAGPGVVSELAALCQDQQELLILGRVGDFSPTTEQLTKLSGFAYLSGDDPWRSLTQLAGVATQPDKVRMFEYTDPNYPRALPLVRMMNTTFAARAAKLQSAVAGVSGPGRARLDDLAESLQLLALRATVVAELYTSASPGITVTDAALHTAAAERAIMLGTDVTAGRIARSPLKNPDRVYGWRPSNPTTYAFGYVWTAKALYYSWRDFGLVTRGTRELGPCYLNIQAPLATALGAGENISEWLAAATRRSSKTWERLVAECVAPPPAEPMFPRDLFPNDTTVLV